jgi:hypothetical protein
METRLLTKTSRSVNAKLPLFFQQESSTFQIAELSYWDRVIILGVDLWHPSHYVGFSGVFAGFPETLTSLLSGSSYLWLDRLSSVIRAA